MFDEMYYEVDRARRAVSRASLYITQGTSGGLPVAERLAEIANAAGALHVDNSHLRRFVFGTGEFAITRDAAVGLATIVEVAERCETERRRVWHNEM
jgi:hypothetical protein